MKKIFILIFASLTLLAFTGCNKMPKEFTNTKELDIVNLNYDFKDGNQGWVFDAADLPENEKEGTFYEIEMKRDKIPNTNEQGLYIKGNNHSDDLFLYIFKQIGNLNPGERYKADISFDLYTNVPAGMGGVGGSPGEGVTVKAGFTNKVPETYVDDNAHVRVNFDKSNQTQSGSEVKAVGDLAKDDGSYDMSWAKKRFNLSMYTNASDEGQLWAIIGTDSGYESLSEYYITNIYIKLNRE